MHAALRYVKLTLLPMLVMLNVQSPAAAQFDDEPEWEESPFQEALRLGTQAYERWKLEDAERHLRRALTLVNEEPEDKQVYASSYTRVYLSRILDALNREEEALEFHESAMDAMLSPDSYLDDEDRADMLREHAGIQSQLGLWDEAEETLERSFEHAQEWYGEDNPWAISYLVPKAAIFMQTERTDEAIDIHKMVLENYEERYGRTNPGLLGTLGAASFDAAIAGEHELALEWFEWMLEIESNQYHHTDHQLVSRRHWVADMAANTGDTDLATEQFYKAIESLESALGDENSTVAGLYASLANTKVAGGDLEGGLDAIDAGLEIVEDADEEQRLRIDLLMYKVNLLRMLDRDDEADEVFERLRAVIDG